MKRRTKKKNNAIDTAELDTAEPDYTDQQKLLIECIGYLMKYKNAPYTGAAMTYFMHEIMKLEKDQ